MQPARLPPQCHLIIRHCFELRHSGFVIFSFFFRNSSLVSVQEVRFRPLNTRKKSKLRWGHLACSVSSSFVCFACFVGRRLFQNPQSDAGTHRTHKALPAHGRAARNACRERTSFQETHSRRVKRPSLRRAARNQLSTLNSPPPTAVTAEDAESAEALGLPWAEASASPVEARLA